MGRRNATILPKNVLLAYNEDRPTNFGEEKG